MHSTDLLVLGQSNLLPVHSQVKGRVKKTSYRIIQTHLNSNSPTPFIKTQSQQFCSSPRISHKTKEELNMFCNETYRSEVRQKETKTVSTSLPNKKLISTILIQNYVRNQPKTEEAIIHTTQTPTKQCFNQKFNRYQKVNIYDFQSESRMSLSLFQQNFKTMRLKKMISKTEQMILLKLQGQTCRTSRNLKNDQKLCKDRKNLYITQHSGQINFEKPSQTMCSAKKIQSIIGRLREQEQKQIIKPDQENKAHKYKNRSVSASNKKYNRKTSARQRFHVNIINFVQQKQTENALIDKKTPFNQLYNRFAKVNNLKIQQISDKEIRRIQMSSRVLVSPEMKDLEVDNRNKTQDFQHQRSSSCQHRQKKQRYFQSTAQQKFKQRKSILRNYTFKKHDTNPNSKVKEQNNSPQDFYVSGWNNSTQFERRQLIMLI